MKSKELLKRNKIMESAFLHFSSFSYSDVKIAEIAKSANVSSSLLYYYYENKEQLFIESYAYILEQRIRLIDQLTFKELVLIFTSIFVENYRYSVSINKLILLKSDIKEEFFDIIYSYLKLCTDVESTDYESYLVVLVSLNAYPGVMLSSENMSFTVDNIIEIYKKLLK